jgi:hypothetical protein
MMIDLHVKQRMILPATSSGSVCGWLQPAQLRVNIDWLEKRRQPCQSFLCPENAADQL